MKLRKYNCDISKAEGEASSTRSLEMAELLATLHLSPFSQLQVPLRIVTSKYPRRRRKSANWRHLHLPNASEYPDFGREMNGKLCFIESHTDLKEKLDKIRSKIGPNGPVTHLILHRQSARINLLAGIISIETFRAFRETNAAAFAPGRRGDVLLYSHLQISSTLLSGNTQQISNIS